MDAGERKHAVRLARVRLGAVVDDLNRAVHVRVSDFDIDGIVERAELFLRQARNERDGLV